MANEEAFLIGGGQVHRLIGPRGETPPCADAKFKRGDVVRRRNLKHMRHMPAGEFIVLVAVPPGFSPDHALADLVGEPRPFMAQVGARCITYIAVRENDPKPYLFREHQIQPSGKEPIEIGTVSRAS